MARKKKTPQLELTLPAPSEIKNSLRSYRVDVTEEDIKKGSPMDPNKCAAAQALMRTLGADRVDVHRGVVYVHTERQGWQRYKTSSGLRLETIVFDRGGMFVPGEYDLNPVPLSQSVGGPKKSRKPGLSVRDAKLATRRHVIGHVRRSARARKEGDE